MQELWLEFSAFARPLLCATTLISSLKGGLNLGRHVEQTIVLRR